jgi:hypothetical protein
MGEDPRAAGRYRPVNVEGGIAQMTDPTPGDPTPAAPAPAPPAAPAASTPSASAASAAAARPTGVTILAILAGAAGVVRAVYGIGAFVFTSVVGTGPGVVLSLLAIAVAALFITFCYGALTRQAWTWPLGVATAAASVILSVLSILGNGTLLGELVSIVIAGAVLYYLYQPGIRSYFGQK